MFRTLLSFLVLPAVLFGQSPKKKSAAAGDEPPGVSSRAKMAALVTATDPSAIQVAAGFKVELVYTVPKGDQGSWVAMALDPKGRILTSDQYGGIYRITLPPLGTTAGTKVEHLAIDFTKFTLPNAPAVEPDAAPKKEKAKADTGPRLEVGAHGLLYAFDSLYVMVNEQRGKTGLWRVRSTKGDDQFDQVEFLRPMNGSGEHGTHALVLSPDGKSIYFANGNHTDLPKAMEQARMVAWGEDHLLPRMWDARGHARNKFAPGGYIARTDPEGKSIELFSIGFRNQYDMAFDQNGELFTYDSDMEWDQGSPWYMPTRINHAVDGGDFGWRSGAGRWPSYYADSLGEVVNIGPGCPVGVTFGTGARFPAKFQHALFAADWTFGTLYAINLTPDGATFRGEKTEFVSGKPLPFTDVIVNPNDGAMYFTVGGRRTQSALYRVTYTGGESTAPAKLPGPTEAAKLRRSLETLHAEGTGPSAIDTAWPHLASKDRSVRFAARVAIERQPAEKWADRALAELQPQASIEALIALARVGDKSLQPKIIAALGRLDFGAQPDELRQPLLRAWQLAFTRMGKPTPETCAAIAAKLDRHFPHADPLVNRELSALLIYLGSTQVVGKIVPLLSVSEPPTVYGEDLGGAAVNARNDSYGKVVNSVADSRPDRQQIAYAYNLRNATVGWTPKLRTEYFSWFSRTRTWKGGNSFGGFIQNIRTESLANVIDRTDRAALDALSKPAPASFAAPAFTPKGPGRAYTVPDAMAAMPAKLTGRNFARGQAMFSAAACIVCHKFGNEGTSGVGPDLTGSGGRYSIRDLLENIIEPSKVISDQFGSEEIERSDGDTIVGRVVGEENGELLVMANPFAPDEKVKVKVSAVKSRKAFGTSMMPPGLINSLSEDELKDLLAYLLSSGNPADPMFK
ncbi:c-type cytochrome [Horticoccus sp. 23ND18S-11]|uniref:c-type cytochrome n=1 Tax=Horticoccus sp. 23ND18S-11 TaxID=3391832 RepID=UPI0039C9BBA0